LTCGFGSYFCRFLVLTLGTTIETLVALESGDLPLEDSLQIYELGTRLAAHCAQKLETAELRVRRWQDGGDLPFDSWRGDESN
jgi:exodeoxyribonuclease VII small subunit